jgi:quercetin dioxygenase-like cupin family protein
MKITAAATHPVMPASPDWFAGTARIEHLHAPEAPTRAHAVRVTFAAGARTVWHTHPLGQLLIVTEGTCLVQSWGGPVTALAPGDTAWFAPGEKHWHGAGPDTPMTHIALHEALDGKSVDWLEPVA